MMAVGDGETSGAFEAIMGAQDWGDVTFDMPPEREGRVVYVGGMGPVPDRARVTSCLPTEGAVAPPRAVEVEDCLDDTEDDLLVDTEVRTLSTADTLKSVGAALVSLTYAGVQVPPAVLMSLLRVNGWFKR